MALEKVDLSTHYIVRKRSCKYNLQQNGFKKQTYNILDSSAKMILFWVYPASSHFYTKQTYLRTELRIDLDCIGLKPTDLFDYVYSLWSEGHHC